MGLVDGLKVSLKTTGNLVTKEKDSVAVFINVIDPKHTAGLTCSLDLSYRESCCGGSRAPMLLHELEKRAVGFRVKEGSGSGVVRSSHGTSDNKPSVRASAGETFARFFDIVEGQAGLQELNDGDMALISRYVELLDGKLERRLGKRLRGESVGDIHGKIGILRINISGAARQGVGSCSFGHGTGMGRKRGNGLCWDIGKWRGWEFWSRTKE